MLSLMDSKNLIKIGTLITWSIVTVLIVLLFINNPTENNISDEVGGQETVTEVLELNGLSNNLLLMNNKYGVLIRDLDLLIDEEPVTVNDFYTEGDYLIINLSTLSLDSSVEHEIKIIIDEGNFTTTLDLTKVLQLTGESTDLICGDGNCVEGEACVSDCFIELFCDDGVDNNENGLIDEAEARCQECGNSVCESFEDCDSCPSDCLKNGSVCCNALTIIGDCCVDNDCSEGYTCEGNQCTAIEYNCGDGLCINETCATCPSDCLSENETCCGSETISNETLCCNNMVITGDCCNNDDCNNNNFCKNNTCTLITELCGDDQCDLLYETCTNCPNDCLNNDEVCCNGTKIIGDCCNTTDCNGTDFCLENTCYPENTCFTEWSCTGWSACSQENTQTRTCTDLNECDTEEDKPDEEKSCNPDYKLEFAYLYNQYANQLEIEINNKGLESVNSGVVEIIMFNEEVGTATYTANLINELYFEGSEKIIFDINGAHTKIGYLYTIDYTFQDREVSDEITIPNPFNISFKEHEYDSITNQLSVLIEGIGQLNISPCTINLDADDGVIVVESSSDLASTLDINEETTIVFDTLDMSHDVEYTAIYEFEGFNTFSDVQFTPTNPYNIEVLSYSFNAEELSIGFKNIGEKTIPSGEDVIININNEVSGESGEITYNLLTDIIVDEETILPFNTEEYVIEESLTYYITIESPGNVIISDEFII